MSVLLSMQLIITIDHKDLLLSKHLGLSECKNDCPIRVFHHQVHYSRIRVLNEQSI